MGGTNPDEQTGNRLLDALPQRDLEALLESMRLIRVAPREVLYEPDAPLESVFFPVEGMVSLTTLSSDGDAVEAATIGNEGMVGIAALLSAQPIASLRATCQLKASVLAMPADSFHEFAFESPFHRDVLLAYTQTQMAQIAQLVACHALHAIPMRLARWLLQTHDRARSDRFLLTQEFLSEMLGVRRASVSEAAASLQSKGVIEYHRGDIIVLDRLGLERASCECYTILKRQYERLIPA